MAAEKKDFNSVFHNPLKNRETPISGAIFDVGIVENCGKLKNSVSARVFFPQIVENEVESLDFRQKTGKTDRNSMKNGNDF